ncbi:MAG: hypothetical protein BMS9Abin12_2283 [Acidimicrobiia bacterium]|nr:MAG: hypothetical protein BMS9Abin12_2283 [Acidimicrobiia bacterium]
MSGRSTARSTSDPAGTASSPDVVSTMPQTDAAVKSVLLDRGVIEVRPKDLPQQRRENSSDVFHTARRSPACPNNGRPGAMTTSISPPLTLEPERVTPASRRQMQVLWHVMLPHGKPAFLAVVSFAFVISWTE